MMMWEKAWTRRSVLKSGAAAFAAAAAFSRPGTVAGAATQRVRFLFLTDTHLDMKCSQANLSSIAHWIRRHARELNIRYVGHQGDVGDRRGTGPIGEMLKASRKALQPVMDAGIPLSVAIGNHDYDHGSDTRPCEAFNHPDAFGGAFYNGQPGFGATFQTETADPGPDPGGTANHYLTQQIAGRPFLFLTLELFARDKVMGWADQLVKERFPDHEVIVTTHAYLHRQGQLCTGVSYDGFSREPGPEYSNDGQELWDKFFKTWPQLRLISSGHFIDEPRQSYLEQQGEAGNIVHSHFWNYQNWGYRDGRLFTTRREGPYQAAMVKMFELCLTANEVHIQHHIPPAGVEGDPADPAHHANWG